MSHNFKNICMSLLTLTIIILAHISYSSDDFCAEDTIKISVPTPMCNQNGYYEINYSCEHEARISTLLPELQNKVNEMIVESNQNRIYYSVYETKRGLCRQQRLMSKGTTGRMDSKHLIGAAVDFICWDESGKGSWDCDWEPLARIGKSKGLLWGGDFPKHYDPGHFELPPMSPL